MGKTCTVGLNRNFDLWTNPDCSGCSLSKKKHSKTLIYGAAEQYIEPFTPRMD